MTATSLTPLVDHYAGPLALRFYDEAVTELAHGLQAAELARADGAPDALVAAALLHDVGHLVVGDLFDIDDELDGDARHEAAGARLLRGWFGPEVCSPVAMHVTAKRYLCTVRPGYLAALSPSSARSLVVQGGPMTGAEAQRFRSNPAWEDAVVLREWDDRAKVAGAETSTFGDWLPLLESLVRPS